MRNRHAGPCYRCGERVEPGEGHFEKIVGTRKGWRVQHAGCAIQFRGTNVGKEQFVERVKSSKFKTLIR